MSGRSCSGRCGARGPASAWSRGSTSGCTRSGRRCSAGFLELPPRQGGRGREAYRDYMEQAPDQVGGGLLLGAGLGGVCTIVFCHLGPIEAGEEAVAPLRELAPSLDAVAPNPVPGVPAHLGPEQPARDACSPPRRLSPRAVGRLPRHAGRPGEPARREPLLRVPPAARRGARALAARCDGAEHPGRLVGLPVRWPLAPRRRSRSRTAWLGGGLRGRDRAVRTRCGLPEPGRDPTGSRPRTAATVTSGCSRSSAATTPIRSSGPERARAAHPDPRSSRDGRASSARTVRARRH